MQPLPAVSAVLAAAAFAASAAETPITRTAPVVVTASRFEEALGERPINLTVISAEEIRASPGRTVPDVLAERAGIFVRDLFGNNATSTTVDLRGFGVSGAQNTLVLVDGRRIGDIDLSGVQWSAVPLAAVERIEIVRGGGSVLYGAGASSGVINIITRAPKAGGRDLSLGGSVGSYGLREGVAQGAYGSGRLAANLFASHLESDGYRRNNQNRQTNALADLRWSGASSDLSVKLGTDNAGIRLPGARRVQPSAGVNELERDRRGAQTPLDWAQREGDRALFDWNRETSFGAVNIGAGWRQKNQRSYFDFGGFPDYRETELDVWSITPRVRLEAPVLGSANSLVMGVDWYTWDYRLGRSNSPANIGAPFNVVDAQQETLAFYALNTTRVNEQLAITAGARRERLRLDAADVFNPAAPGGAFGSGAPAGSQRLYENAYELGARYRLGPAIAVSAKTVRSYRFANVDEIYESSPTFTNQFQFLRPQTARSHELTVESDGARFGARATVFAMNVRDEIHLDPFTTGVGNRNLPPSRRRGLELEARARPLEQLSATAAYSLVDARFREGVLPGSVFTQQNVSLAGRTVPLVPRHKAMLGVSWAWSEATRLSAVATYVGEQFMDNDEPNSLGVKIPAYTNVDVKLVHRAKRWAIAVTINNLFNEKYYNYAVRSQFVADRYNAYPLPERNGQLSLEYRL